MDAARLIEHLGLAPHPEGGHYRETWRHAGDDGARGDGTAIWYLLQAGECSHWHRFDAVEVWHWYRGAPLELLVSEDGTDVTRIVLGPDFDAGETPQAVVAAGVWQSARTLGEYTLAGCTVAPAFAFEAWELAPPGWVPSKEAGTL